jgi:protein-S-isoprenylcysteine O-methyltransferase Ste14
VKETTAISDGNRQSSSVSTPTAPATLGRRIALIAIYFERYGLSLLFFILAALRIHQLMVFGPKEHAEVNAAPLVGILKEVIWVQMYVCIGLLLLFGRRVMSLPQKLEDLIIPLCATFFNVSYLAVPWFPAALQKNLAPANWQITCIAIGLIFNLLGLWIAVWGAIHLGRSFGVLIEVRKVVLEGAYRWVRHPIYLGHICFITGFAIANFSLAFFILVPAHIILLIYRARLEEARLVEFSPAYAEYQKRTGFILPKFRRTE